MTSGIFCCLCNERGEQEGWTAALGVAQLTVQLRLGGAGGLGGHAPHGQQRRADGNTDSTVKWES